MSVSLHGNILVIDDNTVFRTILAARLRLEGLEVLEAESADDGLEILHQRRFDLILLDMLMPNRDGLEVYQELRADDFMRRLPVIMMTEMAVDTHWETLAYESDGPSFVMGKPADMHIFVDHVSNVLRSLPGVDGR